MCIRDRYNLLFKERAVTSRNSMTEKPTYIVTIESDELPGGQAVGEAALFPGLSAEDSPEYESVLDAACREASRSATLAEVMQSLPPVSSVRFGFESAMMRALARPTANASRLRWLDGEEGIRINGLIWMGLSLIHISPDRPTALSPVRSMKVQVESGRLSAVNSRRSPSFS